MRSKLDQLLQQLCPEGVEYKRLGDITKIFIGSFVKKTLQSDDYPFPVMNGGVSPTGYYDQYNSSAESICISARGSCGYVNYMKENFWAGNSCYVLKSLDRCVCVRFLYHYLKRIERKICSLKTVAGIPAINLEPLSNIQLPIPPLAVQEEIVRKLDRFSQLVDSITEGLPAEIAARQKQYEYYRDKLLTFKPLKKHE